MNSSPGNILTLNSGSSSLKFAVYQAGSGEQRLLSGQVQRIGRPGTSIEIKEPDTTRRLKITASHHGDALELVFAQLLKHEAARNLRAIGHRVVMGGAKYSTPQKITPALLKELRALCQIDPLHMPMELKTIEAARKFRPSLPQVACFDTAFHRTLPAVAQAYALPAALTRQLGIIRYGFHGLSCEYILTELRRLSPVTAKGKVVIAHLGSGASMTAVHGGKSVETTMGFTPAGGLVMGSRTGDIDPGMLVHLAKKKKYSPDQMSDLIYQQSGLLGVSGFSSDMRDLEQARKRNPRAQMAIELFCYQARKALGALAAVLDGLETLVFTGGIGEHSPLARSMVCHNLSYLGIQIDARKNTAGAPIISAKRSPVEVRVINTNEELMIARHSAKLLRS